jgi:hypothetical protein
VQVSNLDIQHCTAVVVEKDRVVHPPNELFQLAMAVALHFE